MGWVLYFKTCTGNCNHTFGSPNLVLSSQDEIARIRKRKRGRNMLNRSGNTTDNLCFRYRFRDVFSRFRRCVYNGTGPLLRKHNGKMELHVSATFQKYGNLWFRPAHAVKCSISFLSLWVGLPVIMVAISLGIAAGKEGLQSYTSDKQ